MTTMAAVHNTTSATADAIRRTLSRGTNFFDFQEVMYAVGASLVPNPDQLPPLPTEEEVSRAKELGQRLILCGPVPMVRLYDTLGNTLGGGKLLYDTDWYGNGKEKFFTKVFWPDWHYRFTTEGVIEDSTGENYLGQTRRLVMYLKEQVYAEQPLPKLYADAVEEFERREEALAELIDKNWKKGVKEVASLAANQLFRETPDLVLWDVVLHHKVNGGYVLPDTWTWTNKRSSGDDLVRVGLAGPHGVGVDFNDPRRSYSYLGVRFSRRVQTLSA